MKNLICILIFSLSGMTLNAYTPMDTSRLNVLAISGLSLRAIPSQSGQVLKVIDFGESVTMVEKTDKKENIEWLSGNWIKVRYQGLEGYVFDGFTSQLPVPMLDFELTQEDLDLTYPLLAWAEYHFDPTGDPDTIQNDHLYSMTQYLEEGIVLKREDSDYHFKSTIIIPDTKISEAYNIMKSMLLTKYERASFDNNTLYVANKYGIIDKIKVDIPSPVEIKQLIDGSVKISVITFHEGCSL